MEKETPEIRRKKAKTNRLRLNASQRETSSDGQEVRRTSSTDSRRGTDSSSRRSSRLKRVETVSGVVAEDLIPMEEDTLNELFEPSTGTDTADEKRDEEAETMEAIESWHGRTINWEEKKRSDSVPTPLVSPFTVNSFAKEQRSPIESKNPMPTSMTNAVRPDRRTSVQIKDDPDNGSEPQHLDSKQFESGQDEDFQVSEPTDAPNEGANNVEQIESSANGNHNWVSDHETFKTNDKGGKTISDKGKTPEETGTPSETPSSHNKEQDGLYSQHQPTDSELTHNNESAIHDLAEDRLDLESGETEGVLDATLSAGAMEDVSHALRPKSPRKEHIRNPDPPGHKERPNITQNPNTIIHSPSIMEWTNPDSQRESSDSDHMQSPDPRRKSPDTDPIQGPDPQVQPSEPEKVNAERNPKQDRVAEDVDPVAWFNSDAPLPGNYKAFFHGTRLPRSSNFDHSSKPGSDTDSLIVSPTRTDEYGQSEEEDYDDVARANAEILSMFEEYKSSSQLKPTFSKKQKAKDERAAKAVDKKNQGARGRNSAVLSESSLSSEGSLLVFSNQDDMRSPTDTEPIQDAFAKVKEEEESQAALHVIELYRANYELQREMEAKEAKFKRDLLIAWTHSRPPPTTFEEKLDRIALEEVQSKEIMNEFGEQQRPIRTDPRLVSRETNVNTLITNARIQQLLEDYRQMYNLANHAVEAASILEFPPLTARCCFYRGLAMYLHRDFTSARDDFVKARGCADLYGISKQSIERYIYLIDTAVDEQTAILEKCPARKDSETASSPSTETLSSTQFSPSTETLSSTQFSPSTASESLTLVEESPRSPVRDASAGPPSSSPSQEERSRVQPHEDESSPTQPLHEPRPVLAVPPDDDAQPTIDEVPDYQPQHEAIAEEIRKDIQESKARSLSVVGDAGPAEANSQRGKVAARSSVASTDWTLLGSTASPGTTRRVPRPRVAPIITSFASPQATHGSEDRDERASDEMDSEEIYAAFGGRPHGTPCEEDASPDSDK